MRCNNKGFMLADAIISLIIFSFIVLIFFSFMRISKYNIEKDNIIVKELEEITSHIDNIYATEDWSVYDNEKTSIKIDPEDDNCEELQIAIKYNSHTGNKTEKLMLEVNGNFINEQYTLDRFKP